MYLPDLIYTFFIIYAMHIIYIIWHEFDLLSRVNNIVTGPVRDPKTLQNNCLAIVWRELATEETSSDNCPADPEIHLSFHISATRFAR